MVIGGYNLKMLSLVYMRLLLSSLFLFFLCFLVVEASLVRDLRVGDFGTDVKFLQQTLNRAGFLVSAVGPGSPGQETNYFGEKTRNAVIRYQETFAGVLLSPFGLSAGTGYVGQLTRQHLLGKKEEGLAVSGSAVETRQESNIKEPPDLQVSKEPVLLSVSPSSGGPDTTVIVRGENFSLSGNTIYTGNQVLRNIASTDGQTLSFVVRNTFNFNFSQPDVEPLVIPLWIYVENEGGISNDLQFDLSLR